MENSNYSDVELTHSNNFSTSKTFRPQRFPSVTRFKVTSYKFCNWKIPLRSKHLILTEILATCKLHITLGFMHTVTWASMTSSIAKISMNMVESWRATRQCSPVCSNLDRTASELCVLSPCQIQLPDVYVQIHYSHPTHTHAHICISKCVTHQFTWQHVMTGMVAHKLYI